MLTLFPAKRVITMNPSHPEAEAVLVKDGRIIEVGGQAQMSPWLNSHPHTVDDRFANSVICPGFIDPHLHPSMAAVILPMEFITAMRWKLPWGTVEPTTTEEKFTARMKELDQAKAPGEALFIWGYHQLWHGEMSRERINSVSSERPIVVWHRSFHELYMNDGMLNAIGATENEFKPGSQIDYARGHFFENGLAYAIMKLNPWIMSPEKYGDGLQKLKQAVHYGGQTSIGDLATGLFEFDTEVEALTAVLNGDDVPFRTRLVPHWARMSAQGRSLDEAVAFAKELKKHNTHRLQFGAYIKLFSDGAFFSQLAQLQEPGYIDGHHGEWLMPPEKLEEQIRAYWHAGFQIHVHVTGDLGLEAALDSLEKMQWERPRFNHGFTFEHFGFSTPEQVARIKALGGQISANVYYLHELSDIYANNGIGFERASQMARVGSCFEQGINTTFHSDFTMAPAEPLNSAWVAVNRINHAGEIMGEAERVTQHQALQAITINAAKTIGFQDITGSIRAGKYADFTILEEDPLLCDPLELRDIPIQATVFEGTIFPVE